MKIRILFIFLLSPLFFYGQKVLTQQDLLDVIRAYHPVARQASLQVEMARAGVVAARAGFDPVLQTDLGRKEYKGQLYYDYRRHELSIPTWFGVDLNAGLETLSGEKTNPEATKGSSSYIGLSVPLAKGLLMDARRAALQQAKIFQRASFEEQRVMLNDLMLDAAKAYWNWWEQYETYQLFQAAFDNATERFRLIKTAYRIGERPAIDTLEALTQLQSFQIRRSEVAQQLTNARLELSAFLWQQDGEPYDLPAAITPVRPDGLIIADMDGLLNNIGNHPLLRQYQFKIDALQVERRLKFQYMLPYVTFKYNQLANGHGVGKAFNSPLFEYNYRYGVSFALPLRLSEGRGEYRRARLKLESAEWDRANKLVQLETKVRQYRNDWEQLQQQVQLQQVAVSQYATLQRAEEMRFMNGESSLFLINSREIKTLEARQKLIELQSKQQKAAVSIRWAAGVLPN